MRVPRARDRGLGQPVNSKARAWATRLYVAAEAATYKQSRVLTQTLKGRHYKDERAGALGVGDKSAGRRPQRMRELHRRLQGLKPFTLAAYVAAEAATS